MNEGLATGDSDSLDDLVGFMSGLLLGPDPQVRSWISLFIRNGQRRRNDDLSRFRRCLAARVAACVAALGGHPAADAAVAAGGEDDEEEGGSATQSSDTSSVCQSEVVKAAAILRLYAALRGIAGMK